MQPSLQPKLSHRRYASVSYALRNNTVRMQKCIWTRRNLDLLSYKLENLFSNAHPHDEYLCHVSLKYIHQVQRYHGT